MLKWIISNMYYLAVNHVDKDVSCRLVFSFNFYANLSNNASLLVHIFFIP
jgi:hypothetical protein